MTNPNNDQQPMDTADVERDDLDIDWEQALAEQKAGEQAQQEEALESSQAKGLGGLDDEWSAALAEQAQGEQQRSPEQPKSSEQSAEPIFKPLDQQGDGAQSEIDMIMDIPVQLSVELGRTRLTIKNILQLGQGSVVELDGLAGEPMDIFVNGYLIAQGEVVVVDDKYGIRITDIVTPSDRIHRLNTRR